MKILHVISSLVRGGRERQLATIYKFSNNRKYVNKILIFNHVKDNYNDEYDIKDDDIITLNSKRSKQRLTEIIRIFKDQKPDLIYAWGGFEATFCFLASPFTEGKIVNGSIRHGKVLLNAKQVWRLILLHLSKYIIANSMAGLHANFLKRGYILYNGIDDKFIGQALPEKKTEAKKQFVANYSGETILASVANLVPYKDYYTIINALSAINKKGYKFFYFIIGDGSMKITIQEQIDKLGLNGRIKILGKISIVFDYLQLSDIFLHSSKGEGCSNAILEAMGSGLPVIATDTGGTSEICGDRNGRLFEYKNIEQLTTFLEELIQNESLRKKLGQASFDRINKDFTIRKMIANYYDIIEKIVS